MADWYVSSANYAAVPAWAATTAYTVGQLVKPTAPTAATSMVFRCTTAGTSGGTEPTWSTALNNNATRTDGTVTWTNVSGQSAYGWSAAAGTLYVLMSAGPSGINRVLVGDRVFIASDHSETAPSSPTYRTNDGTQAFGLAQIVSVNRAGSVPPVAADAQSGAAISNSTGQFLLEAYCDVYWQGISFVQAAAAQFFLNSAGLRQQYFKNCAIAMTANNAAPRLACNNPMRVTLENTTLQFGNAGQGIGGGLYGMDLTWLNTPAALVGSTFPTALFSTASTYGCPSAICRGVDLSALTGTLLGSSIGYYKVLLDSCRIAPGVTRLSTPTALTGFNDEIELVNCFDGTNVINERHTHAGAATTDRSTTLSGGAADDIGTYSLKMVSSTRADKSVLPLDCFWLDVENTAIGAAKTATVEIASSASLNNDDVSLLLEYMSASAAVAATWEAATATAVTLSGGGLVATNTGTTSADQGAHVPSTMGQTSGKYYFEATWTTYTGGANFGVGIGTTGSTYTNMGNGGTTGDVAYRGDSVWSNGSSILLSLGGAWAAGQVIGIAVDLDNRRIWFRTASTPGSPWNNNAANNPATNVGGLVVPAGTMVPFVTFGGGSGVAGNAMTANFGASSFSGTVPSGFTSGWPGLAAAPVGSFASSLPSVLATPAALPSSSATWNWSIPSATAWNPADKSTTAVVGGTGNLTATASSGGNTGVRSTNPLAAGKVYFEIKINNTVASSAVLGLAKTGVSPELITGNPANGGVVVAWVNGNIFLVSASPSGVSLGVFANNDVICVALDIGAGLVWFRKNGGNWNNSGTANPATATGGLSTSLLPLPYYGFTGTASGADSSTANFGATTFAQTVPSGFVSWNVAATTMASQKLQVTFTPQRAGRVRGLVKLGKVSATVWVDPQIAIN